MPHFQKKSPRNKPKLGPSCLVVDDIPWVHSGQRAAISVDGYRVTSEKSFQWTMLNQNHQNRDSPTKIPSREHSTFLFSGCWHLTSAAGISRTHLSSSSANSLGVCVCGDDKKVKTVCCSFPKTARSETHLITFWHKYEWKYLNYTLHFLLWRWTSQVWLKAPQKMIAKHYRVSHWFFKKNSEAFGPSSESTTATSTSEEGRLVPQPWEPTNATSSTMTVQLPSSRLWGDTTRFPWLSKETMRGNASCFL